MSVADTRVAVVGGGIMGAGIAFVARAAGFPVTIVEADSDALAAAGARVERHEQQARSRGADLTELGPLTLAPDLTTAVKEADIVIEAVPEQLELKCSVFAVAGAAVTDDAVLASNTSGLSIAVLGTASGRPGQTIGLHFFNPVPAMSLVEVVRGPETTHATIERALAFCDALGKETIAVHDSPGFVTTRLGVVLMAEAMRVYDEGVASAADIDTGMRLGYNHPVGPLALADRIGLDTLLAILDDLRATHGNAFRAPKGLRDMVRAGKLGRKSGRGYYDYTSESI